MVYTPRALSDLLMKNIVDLVNISYVVLDEADCMLNMGFGPQICTWPVQMTYIVEKYFFFGLSPNFNLLDQPIIMF